MTGTVRIAAIDIGTNSVKMTVGEVSDGRVTSVQEEHRITRLGKGVDASGRLADEPMSRTLDAVAEFAQSARRLGAEKLIAAGTSALRDAANGGEFVDRILQRTGIALEIVTGDREAQLAYAAVISDPALNLRDDGTVFVFDIGGGSTEMIVGGGTGVDRFTSANVGAVRLTERHIHADPPEPYEIEAVRIDARRAIDVFHPPHAFAVGIGGTSVNVAAVVRRQSDKESLHAQVITYTDVQDVLNQFTSVGLDQRRRIVGLEAERADVIIAGTIILGQLLEAATADRYQVSIRGLRFGMIADAAGRVH